MIGRLDTLMRCSMKWTVTVLSQGQRRLLAMLDGAGPRGCPEAMILANGFDIEWVTDVVRAGLATVATQTVRAGDRTLGISNMKITDAGRRALESE
jgi:hypothetical protein